MDSETGFLTLTPDALGPALVAVVCMRVDEYRDGVLINSNWRDLQVEAVSCTGGPPFATAWGVVSGGAATGPDTITALPGDTLRLYSLWADNDSGDLLTFMGGVSQQLSGATVSTGVQGDSIAVQWPVPASAAGTSLPLLLQVRDNSCTYFQTGLQKLIIRVPRISLSAAVTASACNPFPSSGSIDLTVAGGTPPYVFAWNTGDSTEDLTGLPGGDYVVSVTDSLGLMVSDSFFVPQGDIQLNATMVAPDCNGTNGGISLSPTQGMPPYSVAWSTGDTSSTLSGLGVGGYSVVVTDAQGCFTQQVFALSYDDSCRAVLSGRAFYDANGNCVQDPGELGLSGLLVDLFPGGAALTDSSGSYRFEVTAGLWDIMLTLPHPYLDSCQVSSGYGVGVGIDLVGQDSLDFALSLEPSPDLRVSQHVMTAMVPGDTVWVDIYGQNFGFEAQAATMRWAFDPAQLSVISTQPAGATVAADTVVFAPVSLPPGYASSVRVRVAVDTTLMIGDTVHTFAQIAPLTGDPTPADNRDSLRSPVLASYDPNDKQVHPAGIGPAGLIPPNDTQRTYTVRFQNTGTYPAQVVVIRDTIDPDLDITSLRILGSSHARTTRIEADSILVLTFANINLPDSASDPTGSIGYVRFRLTHQPGLPLGTRITNRAAIYFDYNPPIFTNTVANTLYLPEGGGVGLAPAPFDAVQVMPNPFRDQALIHLGRPMDVRFTLMNAQGQTLRQRDLRQVEAIPVTRGELVPGVYVFTLEVEGQRYVGKLMLR